MPILEVPGQLLINVQPEELFATTEQSGWNINNILLKLQWKGLIFRYYITKREAKAATYEATGWLKEFESKLTQQADSDNGSIVCERVQQTLSQ